MVQKLGWKQKLFGSDGISHIYSLFFDSFALFWFLKDRRSFLDEIISADDAGTEALSESMFWHVGDY